jgi:superfamily II DNA or RNA helicase
MSDIWKVFSKAELQDLIGPGTLDRLVNLVPAINPSTEPDSIFYKDTLAKIFDAFAGPDAIVNRKFREQFLNHLTPEQIDGVLKQTGTKGDGLAFDQQISKLAGRGWKNEQFCKSFLDALGLPSTLMPAQQVEVEYQQVVDPPSIPLKILKDYQFRVFKAASDKAAIANSRFVIQMPTGSGKTRTAMELVSAFLNESSEKRAIVWLAHSEELCEQAYEGFLEVWHHVGQHSVRVVRCWGAGAKVPFDFDERAFVIGGFQKMYSLLNGNEIPFNELRDRIDIVIVDEAHKVLAPTYKEVTKALVGNGTRVIGLTATPGRSALDAEQNKALANFFFNQIVSIDSGHETVIGFLRKRKVLSEVIYEPIRTELKYELSAHDRLYLENFFDLPPGMLSKIASDDVRNVEILKRLQHECQEGGQVIFFACSVEHSKFITAMLLYLGFKAAHIDGQTSRGRRQNVISDFKKRKIQVVCNFGVLSTGFDAPKTDVVFISRPTASIVLYSQMVGRGLRGPAIGGTEICRVVDVKDNIIGFSNQEVVYDYFEEYFRPSNA